MSWDRSRDARGRDGGGRSDRKVRGRPLTIVIGGLEHDAAIVLAKLARHSMVAHVDCPEEAIDLLESTMSPRAPVEDEHAPLTVGSLCIDASERRVMVGEVALAVSENEFRLLHVFSLSPRKALSYGDLIVAVSGSTRGMDVSALFAAVRRLRRKLASAAADVRIEAVRGFGFRLVAADRVAEPAPLPVT